MNPHAGLTPPVTPSLKIHTYAMKIFCPSILDFAADYPSDLFDPLDARSPPSRQRHPPARVPSARAGVINGAPLPYMTPPRDEKAKGPLGVGRGGWTTVDER